MDMDDRCYLAAMRILDYRFNSEAELRRKLRAKRFDAEAIDATMARLRQERWLDDDRFAAAFARARSQKGIGRFRILRELEAAGIAQDAAQRALSENIDEERQRRQLIALRDKRARTLARRHGDEYLRTDEGAANLASHLIARGYDPALVWEVVREMTSS